MLGLTTAKAYTSALLTGLGATAAALVQAGIGGGIGLVAVIVVAVLGAYGIVWKVPNATSGAHAHGAGDVTE